jgi:hypothetical protein
MLVLKQWYIQLQHSAICQETNHAYAFIGQSRDERKLCHCRTLEDSPLSILYLFLFVFLPSHPTYFCVIFRETRATKPQNYGSAGRG